MRAVAFHFNVPDKVHYTCRLLRKAYMGGHSLFVLVPARQLDSLDVALWTLSPQTFIPHCRSTAAEWIKSRTPIHIGSTLEMLRPGSVLVNLQHEWVDQWRAFGKIIEVVSLDEGDRQAARERWRRYKAEGVEPVRHDIQQAPASA
jgi:DNA polymerase-3 subunit chi